MVAGQDGVRHLGVLEDLHGRVGHHPLRFLALLVDHVAQVDQEGDVEAGGVVGHPLGLGAEGFAAELARELAVLGHGGIACIELRVRQHRQREAGDRLRRLWSLRRGAGTACGRCRGGVVIAAGAGGQQRAAADRQQGGAQPGLEQVAPARVGRGGEAWRDGAVDGDEVGTLGGGFFHDCRFRGLARRRRGARSPPGSGKNQAKIRQKKTLARARARRRHWHAAAVRALPRGSRIRAYR